MNTTPPWTQNIYYSNFFKWDNNFTKPTATFFGFKWIYKSLDLGFNYYYLDNYIYFGDSAKPLQAAEKFNTYSAFINKTFSLNRLRLVNRLVYQYVSNSRYLHLPEFCIYKSVSYDFSIFNRALIIQAGIDFRYSSSFFGDAYMPAAREFYYQDKIKLPENISLDPFLNFRIKRAKIFVKYQHINYLFTKHKTYLAPLYPLQDAALKFGILWRFFD